MNDDIRKYRAIITESYVLDSRSDEIDALIDAIRRVDEVAFLAPLAAAGGTAVAGMLGRIGVQRLLQGAVPQFAPKVANWLSRGAATGSAAGAARTAATTARTGAGTGAGRVFNRGAGPYGVGGGAAGGTAGGTVATGAARSGGMVGGAIKKGAEIAGIGVGGSMAASGLSKMAGKGIRKIGKDVIEDTAESFLETPAGRRMDNASPQTLKQTTERVLVQNGLEPEAADGFLDVLKRSGLFAGGAFGLLMLFMIISYLIANPQAVQQIAGAFGGDS